MTPSNQKVIVFSNSCFTNYLQFSFLLFRFVKDNEKFKKLVKRCVEESQAKVNQKPTNEDPNYLHFEPYDESINKIARKQMMEEQ